MFVTVGDDLVLHIEKPVAGGWMIARHGRQVVLVGGAIPGERVRARVTGNRRGVMYAFAADVLDAAPDRRAMAEERPCGGTVFAHIAYPGQVALKGAIIADALARIGRVVLPAPVPVRPSREDGYRMRARLHVAGGRIGFYREGSHVLCDPAATGQLLPATLTVLERVADELRRWSGPRVLGIEIAENMPATERALHLEVDRLPREDELAAFDLPGVTGVTCADRRDGAARLAFGTPTVRDAVEIRRGGVTARVSLLRHPAAFFQANRYLFPELIARVADLTATDDVLDLYAGVGGFALALAALGHRNVTAVEGDPTSAGDLRRNALEWPGVRVEAIPVEHYLARCRRVPDLTVILDPPRSGMTRSALTGVLALRPARLVYVSCDVATLARDTARFVAAGYRLTTLEGLDLFPNTAHVEAVAAFTSA